jgi:hypothetical protein
VKLGGARVHPRWQPLRGPDLAALVVLLRSCAVEYAASGHASEAESGGFWNLHGRVSLSRRRCLTLALLLGQITAMPRPSSVPGVAYQY